MNPPHLTTAQALATYCTECGARPHRPCVYVTTTNLTHPGSATTAILEARARIGTSTKRPHNERYHHPYYRLKHWLRKNAHLFTQEPR